MRGPAVFVFVFLVLSQRSNLLGFILYWSDDGRFYADRRLEDRPYFQIL